MVWFNGKLIKEFDLMCVYQDKQTNLENYNLSEDKLVANLINLL
jgi:hypothetical protein